MQGTDGFEDDLGAERGVGRVGLLVGSMADPVPAGHEDHGGRNVVARRDIVSCAAPDGMSMNGSPGRGRPPASSACDEALVHVA